MIFFQVIKRFKGRKNKLEGRMRPAGLTLAMSGLKSLGLSVQFAFDIEV